MLTLLSGTGRVRARAGKLFVALAVLVVVASTAAAQIPPYPPCSVYGNTPTLRAEGLAELTGDLVLNCYGPMPPSLDVRVALNTNVTNNRNYQGLDITDAVLVPEVACYTPPCVSSQPLFGRLMPDNKTLMWQITPAVVPPGSLSTLRITNIRANAYMLGPSLMAPATVTARVTLHLPGDPNPMFALGDFVTGMVIPSPQAMVMAGQGVESFRIHIQESFPGAWMPLGAPYPNPMWMPGGQEDGYYTPGSGKNDGGATQGTRMIVRFLNASNGTKILLPNALTIGPMTLQRVFNADAAGAGGCFDISCLPAPPAGSLGEAGRAGRDAFVVYEVTSGIPYAIVAVDVPVFLCGGVSKDGGCHVLAGTIAMREMQVRVSYAPVSAAGIADSVSPRPRFAETGVPIDLLKWPR